LSAELPDLGRREFVEAITGLSPRPLPPGAADRLWTHYSELVRWNRRLSLVGPGTASDVLRRHYGESLAALPLLGGEDRRLVDVGSGAGFPGFVLAAARPDMEVTLVEATQKKWSFLALVCEKTALPCRCLNARVNQALAGELPQQIDVVTTRAVKLSGADVEALVRRLSSRGRFLLWSSRGAGSATRDVLPGRVALHPGREERLSGSERRHIVELLPNPSETA
jgi:16S rRNA (guanine527-N7)-methyltransferase